jgi:hypothetical protein
MNIAKKILSYSKTLYIYKTYTWRKMLENKTLQKVHEYSNKLPYKSTFLYTCCYIPNKCTTYTYGEFFYTQNIPKYIRTKIKNEVKVKFFCTHQRDLQETNKEIEKRLRDRSKIYIYKSFFARKLLY